MNEGMENLKQIAELEEKCMKDKTLIVKKKNVWGNERIYPVCNKAIIEYIIRWLDSNIDEKDVYTDSADLKEKIQLALVPEVTAQDVNNGDF